MKQLKVYVVGLSTGYARWINSDYSIVNDPKEADLAIFTGGEDVSPQLYLDNKDRSTYNNVNRDMNEIGEFIHMPKNLLKVGICRGAQLLTVLAGGALIQDVICHAGNPHEITTKDGDEYMMTSMHHQMMMPYMLKPSEYTLLAWSKSRRSSKYTTGGLFEIKDKDNFKEPEIVYYPKINALCIQGHPEVLPKEHKTNIYINNLIKHYIND